MTDAAQQYEEMKCSVPKWHLPDAVKKCAYRVCDSSRGEPREARSGKIRKEWLDREYDNPTHEYVHGSGQPVETSGAKQLRRNSDERHAPAYAED